MRLVTDGQLHLGHTALPGGDEGEKEPHHGLEVLVTSDLVSRPLVSERLRALVLVNGRVVAALNRTSV